jgi:methylated-DNA-[protein]-cysteine S-methyltransferase
MSTLHIAASQSTPWWFGVAWEDTNIVATAVGSSREEALRNAQRCLPVGAEPLCAEETSSFLAETVTMLGEIERGDETNKRFTLSDSYRSLPMRRILNAAARIPLGYVSTYGEIAEAVGSQARAVGRAMATNPVYPIVPCHRVIGSDMSLVGYGGRQDEKALAAKLERLISEARQAPLPLDVEFPGGTLPVYPVERAIEATRESRERQQRRASEEAARKEAERLQYRLL